MDTVANGGEGGGRIKSKPHLLTLEEYIFFMDNNKQVNLSVDQLNQIIGMHGLKKMHKTHKSILYEEVSKIELLNPSRSTLEDDDVSSHAVMSLDDVIKELNDLSWQECRVTSLQTINSVNLQPPTTTTTTTTTKRQRNHLKKLMSGGSVSVSSVEAARVKRKYMKRKFRYVGDMASGGSGSQSWVRRKKRSARIGGSGGGSPSVYLNFDGI